MSNLERDNGKDQDRLEDHKRHHEGSATRMMDLINNPKVADAKDQ